MNKSFHFIGLGTADGGVLLHVTVARWAAGSVLLTRYLQIGASTCHSMTKGQPRGLLDLGGNEAGIAHAYRRAVLVPPGLQVTHLT